MIELLVIRAIHFFGSSTCWFPNYLYGVIVVEDEAFALWTDCFYEFSQKFPSNIGDTGRFSHTMHLTSGAKELSRTLSLKVPLIANLRLFASLMTHNVSLSTSFMDSGGEIFSRMKLGAAPGSSIARN